MDSEWPDPIESVGLGIPNTGTAPGNGFSGGDVVVTTIGPAPLFPYAPAGALGLDLVAGPDSDDLDALALWDDGTISPDTNMPFFDPAADIILFSVRRGSSVIGMPDSFRGIPIVEGDVLTIPLPTPAGGLSPYPAIYVTAEALGLSAIRGGVPGQEFSDDLDALDVSEVPEPTTLAMLLGGVLTAAWMLRRRRTTWRTK